MRCRVSNTIGILCLLLPLGLVGLACGGGGDDTGGEGQACKADGSCNAGLYCTAASLCQSELSLTELGAEIAINYCGWLFGCCTAAELDSFEGGLIPDGTFASGSSCRSFYSPGLASAFSTPAQAAVTAGRGEYFPAQAVACLLEGQVLGCTGNGAQALQDLLELCADAYNGLQALDAECAHQVECQTGLQCHAGTCKAPLAQSATCETGMTALVCAEGLYCDPIGLTCTQRKGVGQACDGTSNLECQTGHWCPDDGSAMVCTALPTDPVCDGL
jgi:hypothetical protein